MGAINNAFNQAIGATAGAALAVKHAKESDFSKMNTAEHAALVANNQAREAESEAKNAALNEFQITQDLARNQADKFFKERDYNRAVEENKKGNIRTPSSVVHQKLTDLEASERAVAELSNKLDGIQVMREKAKEQRAYADKASQIAQNTQKRYQSKWGGR